jgi:hypothetical protein
VNATIRGTDAFYFGRTRIDVGNSDLNEVDIALRPATNIAGKIVFETTPPENLNLTQVFVNASPIDLGALFSGGTRVSQDGTFILKNIAPVEYRLSATGLPAGSYIVAARYGPADVMSAPFPMENETGGLELRIGFTVGRVTGSVGGAGGAAAAGSLVTLIPDESRRQRNDFYFNTTADLNGAFAFNNVPAGDYQLFAWEQIPAGAYQSSEFRYPFEARGQSIHVESGGTVNAQVNVIPAAN